MSDPRVELVDVFTRTPGRGNRAGVLLDAEGLSAAEMQSIAARTAASETAFGFATKRPDDHDVEVRYFSRTCETPICGHATIAFHYVRARRLGIGRAEIRAKTGAGVLPVGVETTGGGTRVTMTQAAPRALGAPGPAALARIMEALGLTDGDLRTDLPVEVVSTGHAKVIVPIRSCGRLRELRPDMERVAALTPEAGASGFFVLALTPPGDGPLYRGRMFAPATGVDEDPVSGNANGAAGAYLFSHGVLGDVRDGVIRYRGRQGEIMNRPGTVDVLLHVAARRIERVQVSGWAVAAAGGGMQ